jgi:creatinine amidohydrolase
MERISLGELTRDEVRTLAPAATVIIPTGAVEQHGPHLPIDYDVRVCLHLCLAAAELARRQVPVFVAPPIPFGISNHHKPYAGVLSLSPQTYLAVLSETATCLAESGFRRIAIINAHGGNHEANAVVAREIRNTHGVSTAASSYWTVAQAAFVGSGISKEPMSLPGHAGKFETSLLLALEEDLVRKDLLPQGKPVTAEQSTYAKGSAVYIAGKRQGDNEGYSDQPFTASKADGARYLAAIVSSLGDFLIAFHNAHPKP